MKDVGTRHKPKNRNPTRKHPKKKAESFSTIPGGDRRNSAINSISRSKQFPTWLPYSCVFFFGVVASFFSKALVANSDKTNRSLPNLHVPHKGQWPKCLNS